MLVLSRNVNESIDIDNGRITIMIVHVRADGRVKLGITAPRDTTIHRREIQEKVNSESLRLQSEHDTSGTDFD
jgi:carbon storage regulator